MAQIDFVISYNDVTGEIKCSGPLPQKLLCYGLLDMARDVVKDYKQGSIIAPELKFQPKGN